MINLTEVGAHVDAAGNVRFGSTCRKSRPPKGYSVVVRVIHELDQFTPRSPARLPPAIRRGPRPRPLVRDDPRPTLGGPVGTSGRPAAIYTATGCCASRAGSRTLSRRSSPTVRPAPPGEARRLRPARPAHPARPSPSPTRIPRTRPGRPRGLRAAGRGVLLHLRRGRERLDTCRAWASTAGTHARHAVPQIFDWGYGRCTSSPRKTTGAARGAQAPGRCVPCRGMAVILDVVYQHVSEDFAYCRVYRDSAEAGPMGAFRTATRPVFHLPGLPVRPGLRPPTTATGWRSTTSTASATTREGLLQRSARPDYANVAFQTYQDSLTITRFDDPAGYRRIIQCAEFIDGHPRSSSGRHIPTAPGRTTS